MPIRPPLALLACLLLTLAGCTPRLPQARAADATATALPPTALPPTASSATASPATETPTAPRIGDGAAEATAPVFYAANVVAEDKVEVLTEVPGRILAVHAEVGAQVQAGDLLVQQDTAVLEARQAQAVAALEVAAAQVELLSEPATEADLEAARAAVSAAESAYQSAIDGPSAEALRAADAQLRQAEAAVDQAQSAYNLVAWRSDIGALPQSLQLQQATLQVEVARAQHDGLVAGAGDAAIAGAYAQVVQARARLATLEAGAKDGQLHAAQAQARQAEAALYLATLELDKAGVRAPIDGVVAGVYAEVGALAPAGTRVATVQSQAVKVEVAVDEARLASLAVGKPVEIRVNAYPERVFAGEIALIAPLLDPATRTVQVTVRPTGDAAALLPGMFATVALGD